MIKSCVHLNRSLNKQKSVQYSGRMNRQFNEAELLRDGGMTSQHWVLLFSASCSLFIHARTGDR